MNEARLIEVLRAPVVSEKAALAAESGNQYLFKVSTTANKLEIKRAVEKMFDVKVERVRVLNVKGKTKRFGARLGKRSDWRKAYVRLASGQEIEMLGSE